MVHVSSEYGPNDVKKRIFASGWWVFFSDSNYLYFYIILIIISHFILLKDFLLNGLFNFSNFIVDGCHVTNG